MYKQNSNIFGIYLKDFYSHHQWCYGLQTVTAASFRLDITPGTPTTGAPDP